MQELRTQNLIVPLFIHSQHKLCLTGRQTTFGWSLRFYFCRVALGSPAHSEILLACVNVSVYLIYLNINVYITNKKIVILQNMELIIFVIYKNCV